MRALQAKSQAQRILGHLAGGKPITTLQAVSMFGCLRLSERIRELRARGHDIGSAMVSVRGKRVARYWLNS